MPAPKNLADALYEECKDILHAEKQALKALPRIAKALDNEELKEALVQHAEETKVQIQRLEQAMEKMGRKVSAKKCVAMEGIIEEGKEIMEEVEDPEVLAAMMIGAVQKQEHYEIASYGTVCTWAEQLGQKDVLKLLKQNLAEEEATDKKLSQLAESIVNEQAMA